MALVLQPDGTSEHFVYTGIDSAQKRVGGYIDMVPFDRRAGYLIMVNDTGLLDNLPRNPQVEALTLYPEVYGPAVIVSYEEAGEKELLDQISPLSRSTFLRALNRMVAVAS